MTKPVMVREEIKVDLDYIPVSVAIENLQYVLEEYGDLRLNLEVTGDYNFERASAYVMHERPENEQEKAEREDQQKRIKDYKRQQYEALKKEFEE